MSATREGLTKSESKCHAKAGRLSLLLIAVALFSSGAAGLVNQVVWQRSLKVFLGGSETICSTVVVLVFMAGLGVGSVWMSTVASKLRHPIRTFGLLEATLAVVNLGICVLLSCNITQSVYALQRVAIASGVPLLALYAVLATLVLAVPCFLMGATMPLAAEALQRNLGISNSRLLGLLFCVNTVGSVVGTVVSGGWMIVGLGLASSLTIAAFMNLGAGLLLLTITKADSAPVEQPEPQAVRTRSIFRPSTEELLGFGLGFCSLAFEMYLFRIFPLRHLPLPFTFAAVLAGFLMYWSLGAAWSARANGPSISTGLMWCGLSCLGTLAMFFAFDTSMPINGIWSLTWFVVAKAPYFIPCIFFGYLFSRVASQAAKSWGKDVGRVYSWNTAGSCIGVLLTTFVGYEMPFYGLVAVIFLTIMTMYAAVKRSESVAHDEPVSTRATWPYPLAGALALAATCLVVDVSEIATGQRMYSGRDGVILIYDGGEMYWDGLWHSKLSANGDHVGTNNWNLAVMPVAAHAADTPIEDVCVIGVGTGITASTLAKLDSVQRVDAYDISSVLNEVYDRHPDGTLRIRENERINLIFQDARTGLALNPQKYDVIQTQPLYLMQAGSALLNSVEFMQLVKDRLKPNGVFCAYSNGTPEQAFAVRETADAVFEYRESFLNGYLLILSNDPIELSAAELAARLESSDPLWTEVRNNEATKSAEAILSLMDIPKLESGDGRLVVTDDKPVIEYPYYLGDQIRSRRYSFSLPHPLTPAASLAPASH